MSTASTAATSQLKIYLHILVIIENRCGKDTVRSQKDSKRADVILNFQLDLVCRTTFLRCRSYLSSSIKNIAFKSTRC